VVVYQGLGEEGKRGRTWQDRIYGAGVLVLVPPNGGIDDTGNS